MRTYRSFFGCFRQECRGNLECCVVPGGDRSRSKLLLKSQRVVFEEYSSHNEWFPGNNGTLGWFSAEDNYTLTCPSAMNADDNRL